MSAANLPVAHCNLIEGHVDILPIHTDWNRHWLNLRGNRVYTSRKEVQVIHTLGAPGRGGLTTWATPLGSGKAFTTAIAWITKKLFESKFPSTPGTHLTCSIVLCSLGQICLAKKLITCHIQLNPARGTRLKKNAQGNFSGNWELARSDFIFFQIIHPIL